jgi:RNA polymerase sigma-70 factor (ECF subfamily)
MRPSVTESQIREIYAETIDALYGFASRKCGGDRALAEDVTQEAWLRAVRDWPHKGLPENPLAWLTAVARNLLLNHLRREPGIALDLVSPRELSEARQDELPPDTHEIAEAVRSALGRLPAPQAQLLEAFHYKRIRVAQIASDLGLTERAIEGRLRRARENLRRELKLTLGTEGELS